MLGSGCSWPGVLYRLCGATNAVLAFTGSKAFGLEAFLLSGQGKDQAQELAHHGHLGLLLQHATADLLVVVVAVDVDATQERESHLAEHFSEQGSALFGDPVLSTVAAAATLTDVQTRVAQQRSYGGKIAQRSGLTQEAGHVEERDAGDVFVERRHGAGCLELGAECLDLGLERLPAFLVVLVVGPERLQAACEEADLLIGQEIAGRLLGPVEEVAQCGKMGVLRTALHRALEAAVSGAEDREGVEAVGLHEGRARGAEGKLGTLVVIRKELTDQRMDAHAHRRAGGLLIGVEAGQAAQLSVGHRKMEMTLGLAEPSDQVHDARILMIGLAGVVRFDFLELRDMLRADEGGAVTQTARGVEQLALVSAGGLGEYAQGLETGLLGYPGAAAQDVLYGVRAVGNFVFDPDGTASLLKRLNDSFETSTQRSSSFEGLTDWRWVMIFMLRGLLS